MNTVLSDLETRGIKREEAVFVGDSEIDLAWARWAGMRFIGVCTGDMTRQKFLDAGHPESLVIDSIASLPKILQALGQ